ncbi:MAG: glycoside hydrolase family 15 protein [Chloroflexota bacterium]|nr:glycoside hydrolase family 15 protein [Chloroflexota bacterium]
MQRTRQPGEVAGQDAGEPAAGAYPPIEDYALIGDGMTAALVSRDGSIDWACLPRYDSPSVFARILDAGRGGHWRIAPAGPYTAARQYVEDTNILSTVFTTPAGEVELLDFMPPQPLIRQALGDNLIVRIVRGRSGTVDIRTRFAPRFDYARADASWTAQEGIGVRASHDGAALTLYADLPLKVVTGGAEDGDAGGVAAILADGQVAVRAGEEIAFVLAYRQRSSLLWPGGVTARAARLLEATTAYWREWIARCAYRGPYAAMVRRSALALKLLDYLPTGAVVAAPTTSLPEAIGGARNWDYRYSWLRDTAFTLYALFGLGYWDEGEIFLDWLVDVAQGDPAELQVLYGVSGERRIEEFELPHLAGYRGSRPVRVGNAAHGQRQLDIYGEVVDCAYLFHKHGGAVDDGLWAFLRAVVDHVCRVWTEPDQGIWEVRSGPRHFVYSKALCWVAVDRGIALAERLGLPADLDHWRQTGAAIMEELAREGYDEGIGAFTQAYGTAELDAAALALLLRKVLPPHDPRLRSTIDRVVERLGEGGLLHRYAPEAVDDGVGGGEGVFLMCSFWLADCYANLGRREEACALFERLLGYANDVGLYAEELDPASGRHLGNFPQAFTHVALINAALSLARAEAPPA